MIKNLYQLLSVIFFIPCIFCISCSSSSNAGSRDPLRSVSDKIEEITGPVLFDTEKIFDKEVILYPGAFIKTTSKGKVIFTKPITILGPYQVFDQEINIEFKTGTISVLNPVWFGSTGYDTSDDTRSVRKVFELASQIPNAIRVEIPIGKYFISQQIIIESGSAEKYPVYIAGFSNSNDGISGSSFVWDGDRNKSMFLVRNLSNSIFENLDFNATTGKYPKCNLEIRPYVNQLKISNCSFGGCEGIGSANINLNEGNNLQVSELFFDNCIFRGVKTKSEFTPHAVIGGWANTKDFHFSHCSIGPYSEEALKFKATDILVVEGCTFFQNDVDISCETCKSYIVSNYSEGSKALFSATASSNFNATTLINNQFTGTPEDGFVIRDGSGTLILINNNFGSGNYENDLNRIRWEENEYSTIYSVGNVYKNSNSTMPAFYNRSNQPFDYKFFESIGDLGGVLGEGRKKLPRNTQH